MPFEGEGSKAGRRRTLDDAAAVRSVWCSPRLQEGGLVEAVQCSAAKRGHGQDVLTCLLPVVSGKSYNHSSPSGEDRGLPRPTFASRDVTLLTQSITEATG